MPVAPSHADQVPADLQSLRLPPFANQPNAGPSVVAIEGPNGAGKTTLSWALARHLGVPWCLGTDEAWFAEPLKVRMIRDAEWHASAMFFLSGCFEQTRLLRQRSDRLIIMDRSLWSTLAVHAAESTARLQALIAMLQPVAGQIQIPPLTLVLEASFATCQSRISNKSGTARALDELTATSDFHHRERQFYRWLGTQSSSISFLDADQANADQVAEKALSLIRPLISSPRSNSGRC
jgi:thymidylate kinase